MRVIEKILAYPLHLVHTPHPIPTSPIVTYGVASDPPSPPHDSSSETVTPKVNPKPRENTPNLVSYPCLSYSSLLDSSDSSDNEYYKQRWHTKKDKNKCRSKIRFNEPIKKYANLTAKILTAVYRWNIFKFILDEYPLQRRVYFLSFVNSLKIGLSPFSETFMFLMEYPSIRGK